MYSNNVISQNIKGCWSDWSASFAVEMTDWNKTTTTTTTTNNNTNNTSNSNNNGDDDGDWRFRGCFVFQSRVSTKTVVINFSNKRP